MKIKNKGKRSKFRFGWKDLILYGALFFFLMFISFAVGDFASPSGQSSSTIPLSQVINDVKDKKIKEIVVNDAELEIIFKDDKKVKSRKEAGASMYTILSDAKVDPSNVKITIKDASGLNTWIGIISTFLPVL